MRKPEDIIVRAQNLRASGPCRTSLGETYGPIRPDYLLIKIESLRRDSLIPVKRVKRPYVRRVKMRLTNDVRVLVVSVVFLATGLAALSAAADESADNLLDAVTKGTFSLNLRYRYEDVDQTGFEERGRASTLRTTAGYRTREWKGLEVYFEFEGVNDLGLSNDHNNAGAGPLWNGVSDRPVVADPAVTEFNQAYLGWRPIKSLPFRFGLQEIVIDNARFVGNVAWRQNHQTFEAARVAFEGVENLTIRYAYIGRQHTVLGGSLPMSTSHPGAAYSLGKIGAIHAYGMVVDYEREAKWGLSSATVGGFFDGKPKLTDSLGLIYRIEYARQKDAGDNPEHVSAHYGRADLGLSIKKVKIVAGYEVLGGSPEEGRFLTPLATLHKFNGWADKFLNTPTDGLQDLTLTVTAGLGAWKLLAVYHDFSADTGGARWGTEFDAAVFYKTPWKQQVALKFAAYDAKEYATDTTKLWLWTSWGF